MTIPSVMIVPLGILQEFELSSWWESVFKSWNLMKTTRWGLTEGKPLRDVTFNLSIPVVFVLLSGSTVDEERIAPLRERTLGCHIPLVQASDACMTPAQEAYWCVIADNDR